MVFAAFMDEASVFPHPDPGAVNEYPSEFLALGCPRRGGMSLR